MNKLLQFGLVAAGGYLILRAMGFKLPALPAILPSTTQPEKAAAPAQPAPKIDIHGLLLSTARDSLKSTPAMFTGELLDWWQWCFYYEQIRGRDQCAGRGMPEDPRRRISVDEFVAWLTDAGLSGLGAVSIPGLPSWAPAWGEQRRESQEGILYHDRGRRPSWGPQAARRQPPAIRPPATGPLHYDRGLPGTRWLTRRATVV